MLSWKNLWRHRTRSLAIIASVVLGTWAGAFILSIYYGMAEGRVKIAIEQEVSHLQAHHPNFRDEFEAKWHFTQGRMDSLLPKMPGLKAYSFAEMYQIRRITGWFPLESAHSTKVLKIRILNPCDHHRFVSQIVHVLQQKQGNHHSGRVIFLS
jgi:hypothetical protein